METIRQQKYWIYRLLSISAIFLFIFLTFVTELPALASVSFIGDFSNERFTEEHAYGYGVQLWREGDNWFGLLFVSDGLASDTPTGLLNDIHFDAVSGRLTFSAKLSVGVVYFGKGKQAPSHDFFTFEGVLNKNSLSGKLTHVSELQPKGSSEHVRLIKTDRESMSNATSFNEWEKSAEQVLKLRGPKW